VRDRGEGVGRGGRCCIGCDTAQALCEKWMLCTMDIGERIEHDTAE